MKKAVEQTLKPLLPDLKNEWSQRLTNALLGALLFILLGTALPNLYFKYLDKNVYYKINSFETTSAVYKQCDLSTVVILRESKVDSSAKRVVDIVLRNEDKEINIPVHGLTADIFIEKNEAKTIQTDLQIPCNIPNGEYRWLLKIAYTANDIPRYEVAKSNPFLVSNEILDTK